MKKRSAPPSDSGHVELAGTTHCPLPEGRAEDEKRRSCIERTIHHSQENTIDMLGYWWHCGRMSEYDFRKTFHLLPKVHGRLKKLSRLTKVPMTELIDELTKHALENVEEWER